MKANMNRQRAEVATNTANSLLQAGKIEDAVAQFKDALSYDQDYPEAHRGLASALERQGESAAAAAERVKAETLEKTPNR
jgi:Tfp pilus assembly protein PilF